jgi:hypothetical protein
MQAATIIKGAPIAPEDIKEREKYFNGAEAAQVDALAKNNKPIKDYWLNVLQNYFEEDLSPSDKEIGKAVLDISSAVVEDNVELAIEIGPNEWLKPGKFTRKFYTKDGQLTKVEGDKVTWLKKKEDGILTRILDGAQTPEELGTIFPIVGEIINDMVPYSLYSFLGITEEASELEEEDLLDDDEEDDEEEEEGPKKKVKE